MSLLAASIDTSGAESLFNGFLAFILPVGNLLTAVGLCWLGYVVVKQVLGDDKGMGGGKGKYRKYLAPAIMSASAAWAALAHLLFSVIGGLLGLGIDSVNSASGVSKVAATLVRTKTGI